MNGKYMYIDMRDIKLMFPMDLWHHQLELEEKSLINFRALHEGEYIALKRNKANPKPVVLEETYDVERIIWRKRNQQGNGFQYLVKWNGFHKADSTWEPKSHLPERVIEEYIPSNVEVLRQKAFVSEFERTIQGRLKTKNPQSRLSVELDVYRSFFGDQPKLCELTDFDRLGLSNNWYYCLDKDGSGMKLKFPVKLTRKLLMRKMYVKEANKLVAKTVPVERWNIFSCTEACVLDDM